MFPSRRYYWLILIILSAFSALVLTRFHDDPVARVQELGGKYYHEPDSDGMHYIYLTCPPFDTSQIEEFVSATNRTEAPWEIFIDEIPDRFLHRFKRATNIKKIFLGESGIGNKGLIVLAQISSLEEIEIERCWNLNSDGVSALQAKRPDIDVFGWWEDAKDRR